MTSNSGGLASSRGGLRSPTPLESSEERASTTAKPGHSHFTQAIQGTHRPTESDVELITDVEPGDYFFMCTDGTLENLRDSALESIFSSNSSAVGIKYEMQYACNGKTKDNYSFYIIPIQNVQESAGIKQNILSFFYSLV